MAHSRIDGAADDASLAKADGRSVVALGGVQHPRRRSKAHRRFDTLVKRLRAQRLDLEGWKVFAQEYYRLLASNYQPLANKLRARRIAMVQLLDRAYEGPTLSRAQRRKARDIVVALLEGLLADERDAHLVELYDKHAGVSFDERSLGDAHTLHGLALDAYGVDLAPDNDGAARPEQRHARQAAPTRETGLRVLRDVFRKLASTLHPDREPDAVKRSHKTELMKDVNRAYKAGDLLRLLELQNTLAQRDSGSNAVVAADRLAQYTAMLERQSQRFAAELDALTAPFSLGGKGRGRRALTQAAVRRALDLDVAQLKLLLREVEADLANFRDVRFLQRALNDYGIDPRG